MDKHQRVQGPYPRQDSDRTLSLARELYRDIIIQQPFQGNMTPEAIAGRSIELAKIFWSVWEEKPNG